MQKFEINLSVPKYVLKRQKYLEGSIEAKFVLILLLLIEFYEIYDIYYHRYTHGKYVIGEAFIDLKIGLPYQYYGHSNQNLDIQRIIKVNILILSI